MEGILDMCALQTGSSDQLLGGGYGQQEMRFDFPVMRLWV